MSHFSIRVANDDLTFSAGHFITLEDGCCERLHGHSYRVAVEVGGSLNENQYVIDFVAVYNILKAILSELDHRVSSAGATSGDSRFQRCERSRSLVRRPPLGLSGRQLSPAAVGQHYQRTTGGIRWAAAASQVESSWRRTAGAGADRSWRRDRLRGRVGTERGPGRLAPE